MADNEALDAALTLFNDGLKIQQAEEAAQRAVEKADRRKQQAATELKTLQKDPNASAEDKAAADEAYRGAVDSFNKLRSGEVVDDASDNADEAADPDGATEPENNTAESDNAAEPEPAVEPESNANNDSAEPDDAAEGQEDNAEDGETPSTEPAPEEPAAEEPAAEEPATEEPAAE